MKYRLAAALCTLALPSSLAAQDIQIKLDQTLVENFDGNVVPDALTTFNVTVTPKTAANGMPFFDFLFPGGLNARAEPAACRDEAAHTGCTGLALSAFFQLPEGKTAADMAEIVNSFNATHEATQVVYDKTGQTRLIYYIVSDFGITKTNLTVQIYNFRQVAQAWNKALFVKPA